MKRLILSVNQSVSLPHAGSWPGGVLLLVLSAEEVLEVVKYVLNYSILWFINHLLISDISWYAHRHTHTHTNTNIWGT